MANLKASSIAPLAAVDATSSMQPSAEQASEEPRAFHFAVTWATLFEHLDLIESSGPKQKTEAAPTRALVPVLASGLVAPAMIEPPAPIPGSAAWEMVVPRMARSRSGDFTPIKEQAQIP
jgi:hypothetical protein